MKKFLKKYGFTDEEINKLFEAYKKDHADATELPEYIGKVRFDEVNGKLKASEGEVATLKKQIEDLNKGGDEAVKAAVKAKEDELTSKYEAEKSALIKDHEMDNAIMAAHGKSVKAIKALIDPSKELDAEIKRLQKDESYLFDSDIPGGTGKHGKDEPGADEKEAELNELRAAVGVIH